MKNQLDSVLSGVKTERRKALIAYLAAGDPVFSQQEKIIAALAEAGVDVIELGVPFSDPIADGPTIQAASQRALNNGVSLTKILRWVPRLRNRIDIPVVLMTYLNPLEAYGPEKFARDAAKAGVSGVIIPDLIPEEGREWEKRLERAGVHLVYLLAPTTPPARQKEIARRSRGFLYAVSVAGVTGARRTFSPATQRWLSRLRGLSSRPVCVGFGISGPEQVRQLRKSVDGFIVGSALIDQLHVNGASGRIRRVQKFIERLAKECRYAR